MEKPMKKALKIIVVGDVSVGKTSLVLRFTKGHFENKPEVTIGFNYSEFETEVNNQKVCVHLYDTAGEERFFSVTPTYFKRSVGAVLVYDVSNKLTFKALEKWIDNFNYYCPNAIKMIVGNKVDVGIREVSREEGIKFAQHHAALFQESSAKTNENVTEMFHDLLEKILERPDLLEEDPEKALKLHDSNDQIAKKRSCWSCQIR